MRRPRHANAFSLIDLVITVLIMGILAAVAGPRFAATSAGLRSEAVARRIAADLNYARRHAILNSRECTITFNLSPPGYAMVGVADPARVGRTYQVALSDLDGGAAVASAAFNSTRSVTYNAYGLPLAGSPAAALASGAVVVAVAGASRTIVVDKDTGEATLP
ncbi:hypothetical protein Pla175_37920 [Pirellulimonas nuda]|uniref:Type II secretion system protein H n=1 Tax=Pirellulimonas nuda TaxID=2528009 RepID=A0A518DFZ4_9BACT|nr:GspH/FimT family pseudopilin [Pirellulimonas nuda]QDU90388.1 hypothetical protein Pla175_37920 [Pirellulimonas nuda]